jgi:hypothetical protein
VGSVAESDDPPGHYMSLAEEFKTALSGEIAIEGRALTG